MPFSVHEYERGESLHDFGKEAAEKLGFDPDQVFKTLLVTADGRQAVAIVPVSTKVGLKSVGRALDQKASLVRLPGDRSASLRAALRQVAGDGDELDDEHARLHRLTTPTSLDRTIGDDDSNELVDLLPDATPGPEQEVLDRAEQQMVTDLLSVLDHRARYAVEQRFGLHDGRKRSYREVGEELGVTATASSDYHGPTHKTFSRFGAYQTYDLGQPEAPPKP